MRMSWAVGHHCHPTAELATTVALDCVMQMPWVSAHEVPHGGRVIMRGVCVGVWPGGRVMKRGVGVGVWPGGRLLMRYRMGDARNQFSHGTELAPPGACGPARRWAETNALTEPPPPPPPR